MVIVVQNRYFIKPGSEEEALGVRRDATAVRVAAGRQSGRILVTYEPNEGAPTFVWECDYPNPAARDRDAAWADGSVEFSAVRQRMGSLLDHFERLHFEVAPDEA